MEDPDLIPGSIYGSPSTTMNDIWSYNQSKFLKRVEYAPQEIVLY